MQASTTKKRGRVTLAEVAKKAGVSPSTASLVLRGMTRQLRISEETDRRVREVAKEFDYSPNLLVKSIQDGKTQVISFYNAFRHRLLDDIYMDRLSTAIENSCGAISYDVLVHCDFSKSAEEMYRFLNGGRADGLLLFAPRESDPLLPWLRKSRLPVVLVGATDSVGQLSSVKDDVRSGMQQVAQALVSQGHKRIAVIQERGDDVRDAEERTLYLRTALSELGVDLPTDQVFVTDSTRVETLRKILSQDKPPTAIFCWRDWLAYRMLEACHELGVSVPQELSIVGYDGLHWPAATSHVAASVHINLQALADQAVALLNSYINGHEEETKQLVLPVTFDPGTTLGPAPEE